MTASVQGNKSKHTRGLDKTMCKFWANFAFDTATYERTNRSKTTNMSRTYLDITCNITCFTVCSLNVMIGEKKVSSTLMTSSCKKMGLPLQDNPEFPAANINSSSLQSTINQNVCGNGYI